MKKLLVLLLSSVVLLGCAPKAAEENKTETVTATVAPESKKASLEANVVSLTPTSAQYIDFSAEKLAELEGKQKFVLFFHANWCSWCRAREMEIIKSQRTLPADTVIVKADFDQEFDLRKKYDVKAKDEFVFVNEDGSFSSKSGASIETLAQFFTEGTVSTSEDKIKGMAAYGPYHPGVIETFKGKKPYALYFHADWCPSCRFLDKEIRAKIETLPPNTVVFRVDYDSNKELRQKYGVSSQHTVVFFDKDGEKQNSISGFGLDDLVKYFE